VLWSAVAQLRRTDPGAATELQPRIADALEQVVELLSLIGRAVTGKRDRVSELEASGEALGAWGAARSPLASLNADEVLVARIDLRIAALAGQVTAAATLAAAASRAGRSGWL